jgi:hypothetical protein
MKTPSTELVDAYLAEIAKAYGINWSPVTEKKSVEGEDDGGVKVIVHRRATASDRITPLNLSRRAITKSLPMPNSNCNASVRLQMVGGRPNYLICRRQKIMRNLLRLLLHVQIPLRKKMISTLCFSVLRR